jgi:very-short-patch-repair endonuclease
MKRRIRGTTPPVEIKARQMRERPTKAEDILWQELRGEKIRGFQFRRQHPVGRFIFDFCCTKAKLIIEVDGSVHNDEDQRARDDARDEYLARGGYTTLRVTNKEIFDDLASVVARIDAALPRADARFDGQVST